MHVFEEKDKTSVYFNIHLSNEYYNIHSSLCLSADLLTTYKNS